MLTKSLLDALTPGATMKISLLMKVFVLSALPMSLVAGDTTVAVAANFTAPMKRIANEFEIATGHKVRLAFGSSGKFYAQIVNGAPFDLFFSADQAKPSALVAEELAVAGSQYTYALGGLVLWSADKQLIDGNASVLRVLQFHKLAVANARLAPYGKAAMEVLNALEINHSIISSRLVRGENIAQTYQFVSSGNAELGFVALAQVMVDGVIGAGSGWVVPEALYQPIRQDVVLLNKGKENAVAKALLYFVQTDKVKNLIHGFGYRTQSN